MAIEILLLHLARRGNIATTCETGIDPNVGRQAQGLRNHKVLTVACTPSTEDPSGYLARGRHQNCGNWKRTTRVSVKLISWLTAFLVCVPGLAPAQTALEARIEQHFLNAREAEKLGDYQRAV